MNAPKNKCHRLFQYTYSFRYFTKCLFSVCCTFILQVLHTVSLLFRRWCTLSLFYTAGEVLCVSFVLQVLYTVSLFFCRCCTLCLFSSVGAVNFSSAGVVHCVSFVLQVLYTVSLLFFRCCTLCLFCSEGAVHCVYRGDSGLPHEVQRLSPGQADLQVFGNAHREKILGESKQFCLCWQWGGGGLVTGGISSDVNPRCVLLEIIYYR